MAGGCGRDFAGKRLPGRCWASPPTTAAEWVAAKAVRLNFGESGHSILAFRPAVVVGEDAQQRLRKMELVITHSTYSIQQPAAVSRTSKPSSSDK